MKKRTKFIIGFATAALTFGILTATIGQSGYRHHSKHCHSCCQNEKDQPVIQPSREPGASQSGASPTKH
ncbi:MAG: hypothetical protein IPN08_02450 [Bacteroidales bacterium]|nr:hypothetical protein [Bacteroidales bacterium]MBK9356243.1 hypothetical protein [Bacteroidales bacterium]